jgi:glycosyltransferase involved in cell wall biosynthesis
LRTILFFRKYKRFHGGHLKVSNYFNHVLAAPGFDARVLFDPGSSWDASNPWSSMRERVVESLDEVTPDALFVAGRDWQRLEGLGLLDRDLPLLNLVQHIRHADDWSIQSRYLTRKAIRLCVSDEVAAGIQDAGSNGPIVVIPNGVDVPRADTLDTSDQPLDLFIAGLKQPGMAGRAAASLAAPGRSIEVFTDLTPRDAFLAAMRRARVTLFLPNEDEGFYLPALEGMALGTIVVCPDCVGHRSFCLPGFNAFRPPYAFDALITATEEALALPKPKILALVTAARETAQRHSPAAEREAFLRVLANLDDIWAGA